MTVEEGYELKEGDRVQFNERFATVVKPPNVIADDMFMFGDAGSLVVNFDGEAYFWRYKEYYNCYGVDWDSRKASQITLISRASKHPLIKTEFLEGIEL